MAILYGHAGRLTAKNGGFRPGQCLGGAAPTARLRLPGHTSGISCVAVAPPSCSGAWGVSGGRDGTIRRWCVERRACEGRAVLVPPRAREGPLPERYRVSPKAGPT